MKALLITALIISIVMLITLISAAIFTIYYPKTFSKIIQKFEQLCQ